ncbi:MAG: hypothetical protein ACI81R_002254, partial [Bradymonadia bacterium]
NTRGLAACLVGGMLFSPCESLLQLLINSLLQRCAALIASIATYEGARAPLGHVEERMFLALATELENRGLSRKVIADMFGVTLRSYQRKTQRVQQRATDAHGTVWAAVLDFLHGAGPVSRTEVFQRFRYDDEETLRSVLRDLVESGLVFNSGVGSNAVYRCADTDDLAAVGRAGPDELRTVVWATVFRRGPIDRSALVELSGGDTATLDMAIDSLASDGLVRELRDTAGRKRWVADSFRVPLGSQEGWQAAVYDFVDGTVCTIASKLDRTHALPERQDAAGGSTWTLDVWPGHPFEEDAYQMLARLRSEVGTLYEAIEAHNHEAERPDRVHGVTVVCGQTITARERGEATT